MTFIRVKIQEEMKNADSSHTNWPHLGHGRAAVTLGLLYNIHQSICYFTLFFFSLIN